MSDIGDNSTLVSEVFYRDGSLRDIYILGCDRPDWEAAAAFLESEYALRFDGPWNGAQFPPSIADLFHTSANSAATLLKINIGEMVANCHFFSMEEIEFDIEPGEVADAQKVEDVLKFMRGLAAATGKEVILTPENVREFPLLRARPGQHVEWVSYDGAS